MLPVGLKTVLQKSEAEFGVSLMKEKYEFMGSGGKKNELGVSCVKG